MGENRLPVLGCVLRGAITPFQGDKKTGVASKAPPGRCSVRMVSRQGPHLGLCAPGSVLSIHLGTEKLKTGGGGSGGTWKELWGRRQGKW